jgi:hypothetical protein
VVEDLAARQVALEASEAKALAARAGLAAVAGDDPSTSWVGKLSTCHRSYRPW